MGSEMCIRDSLYSVLFYALSELDMPTGNDRNGKKSSGLLPSSFRFRERLPKKSVLRYGMIVLFILLMAMILPKDFVPEFNYELGKPWVAPDLKADFGFPIFKPAAQYEEEKNKALATAPPVFSLDTNVAITVEAKCIAETEGFFSELYNYRSMVEASDVAVGDLRNRIQTRVGLDPELSAVEPLEPHRWRRTL